MFSFSTVHKVLHNSKNSANGRNALEKKRFEISGDDCISRWKATFPGCVWRGCNLFWYHWGRRRLVGLRWFWQAGCATQECHLKCGCDTGGVLSGMPCQYSTGAVHDNGVLTPLAHPNDQTFQHNFGLCVGMSWAVCLWKDDQIFCSKVGARVVCECVLCVGDYGWNGGPVEDSFTRSTTFQSCTKRVSLPKTRHFALSATYSYQNGLHLSESKIHGYNRTKLFLLGKSQLAGRWSTCEA